MARPAYPSALGHSRNSGITSAEAGRLRQENRRYHATGFILHHLVRIPLLSQL
jgi:hypothetical protein